MKQNKKIMTILRLILNILALMIWLWSMFSGFFVIMFSVFGRDANTRRGDELSWFLKEDLWMLISYISMVIISFVLIRNIIRGLKYLDTNKNFNIIKKK